MRLLAMDSERTDSSNWFLTEVQPHGAALRTWLVARFPTLPDVENLVQDSFVRVLRARNVGPVRCARALLFSTARNLAYDVVRRQRVLSFESITEEADSPVLFDNADVIATVSKREELELLTRAIQSLPERCRHIFTLRTAYGLSQRQIAECLAVSESTVEKQTALGIRLCAKFLASGHA
jgi:RNA polymerase sigma factor (sigma-70 family)